MTSAEAHAAVHDAIGGLLDDGEIPIAWCLVVDVVGPEDVRYLAHRSGGGLDGSDSPMVWTAIGMLRASLGVAEEQLSGCSYDPPEDDADA